MKNQYIADFEAVVAKKHGQFKTNFRTGDTIRVFYKLKEAASDKFRLQPFEGTVVRKRKGIVNGSFTVRKIGANGIGVERVFPICSPFIEKIDILAQGIVRRSRLYYLRNLSGKAARIKSRFVAKVAAPAKALETKTAE